MKKLSYCLVGDKTAEKKWHQIKTEGLSLTGLWLWAKAFHQYGKKADIRMVIDRSELEEYDCVHLNLTPGNFGLGHVLRDELKGSSVKLICNIDFEVENWGTIWQYPSLLEKVLDQFDLIFHVENTGASVLEHALNRKIYVLPHPVDLKGIDKMKKIDRDPTIVSVYHRHTPGICTQYMCLKNLPLHRILLGYIGGKVPASPLFDLALSFLPFHDAIDIMSRAKFGYHVHPGYTVGRAICEFAALCVPCICTNTCEAGRRLFPTLTTNPYDIKRQHNLVLDLIEHDDKYVEAFQYAYTEVEYYSMENCYKRMLRALEETEEPTKLKTSDFWDDQYFNSLTYREEHHFTQYTNCWDDLLSYIYNNNIIIDLGCGSGSFAQYLNEKGYTKQYFGYDYSKKAISLANARGLPQIFRFANEEITPEFVANITKGAEDRGNTVVIAISFLNHQKDDKAILGAISPKLPIVATLMMNLGESHLRYFKSVEKAKKYYGDFFDDIRPCGKFLLARRQCVGKH